jgi:hypothetical protein
MPCAGVTLSGATLEIEYGARDGDCTYRGQTYSGTHAITVMRNQQDEAVVEHSWVDFQNETIQVNGNATVTWDFDEGTRRVVHETEWTRLSDGRMAKGSGDRTQKALEDGLATGFSVRGMRGWDGESGQWDLSIEDVEMRWIDPVPQSGRYVLDTPFGKSVQVTFERQSDTRIHVVVESGTKSFDFDVRNRRARDEGS